MHSLVFPTDSSQAESLPGVMTMASGNVTIITRSPRQQKTNKSSNSEKACKRKMEYTPSSSSKPERAPRCKKSKLTGTARRNERERNRVKQVNQGFSKLRDHVPKRGRGRKMSKVDILHSACDYIKQLQGILDESDAVSAVIDLAALSSQLTEDGQLIDDSASDDASTTSSVNTDNCLELNGFPASPTTSYDNFSERASSPSACSMDGSTGSCDQSPVSSCEPSPVSSSYDQHHQYYQDPQQYHQHQQSPEHLRCPEQVQQYSPEHPTLFDLAVWFQ